MSNDFPELPYGLIPFGPLANCTIELCGLEASVLRYKPSIVAQPLFIALFAIALFIHAFQGVYYRMWTFGSCMVAGCILEIVGYAGRMMLRDNPFSFDAFLIQIICITVAPVFFCSAIYILLSQVIILSDRSISRFDPRLFYWIFIPADIISLVLQAAGGGLSATGGDFDAVQIGVDISLAGLSFQVIALTTFSVLFADYIFAYWRKNKGTLSARMKVFLTFLYLGVMFILIRCAYRIAELKDGYFAPMFRDEPKFIALESAVMAIAVFCLVVGHPGRVFGRGRNFAKSQDASPRSMTPEMESTPA